MAVKGAGNIFLRGRVCWEGRNSAPHTILAPLPKGGWHGEAVTGGFFPARTRGKCAAVYPARYPSTSLRLVPLPLGKGGNAFWVVRWGGSSGRPTPTHHLPIELRRGRRPRRPVTSQVAGGRKGRPYRFNFPCGGPGRQRRFGPAYIRFPLGIALLQRRKAPDPAHRPGRGWGRR